MASSWRRESPVACLTSLAADCGARSAPAVKLLADLAQPDGPVLFVRFLSRIAHHHRDAGIQARDGRGPVSRMHSTNSSISTT